MKENHLFFIVTLSFLFLLPACGTQHPNNQVNAEGYGGATKIAIQRYMLNRDNSTKANMNIFPNPAE